MANKPPRDPNEAAHRVLGLITGEIETPKVARAKKGTIEEIVGLLNSN